VSEPQQERPFDASKAEAFGGTLLESLNHGAWCLMASIGHRTGLFDTMRDLPASTAGDIARAARLNERYVREWLGAMVTAGVVVVDATSTFYSLPAEHAAMLTRAAGTDNIAMYAQFIAMLGRVEDDIVACFHKGGGIPYEKFARFYDVLAEDNTVVSTLESDVLPLVPGLTDQLAVGIRVLDVGCGSGRVMNRLAALYPNSRFAGLDFSHEAIRMAKAESLDHGLRNVEFVVRDLSDFDQTADTAAYEWITTFDAVHDQAKPLNVLKGIHRALTPDGVYLMQDIKASSFVHRNLEHPLGTFLYAVSTMHCMTVSLAQGGEGLGAMWGEEKTREYLTVAGFGSIDKHELPHDPMNNWYVVRKGQAR
jgi:2-polyprenyl-3-methyl-5-hydroxy-6-metoxy-1,4-benzoquinol methylase